MRRQKNFFFCFSKNFKLKILSIQKFLTRFKDFGTKVVCSTNDEKVGAINILKFEFYRF